MSRMIRGTVYGSAVVLALALVGSIASRALGFDYDSLAPISLLMYAVVGAYVGVADTVARATLAGAIVGVVDATLGWAVAFAIGPGRPQVGERITFLGFFNTLLFVAAVAAVLAAVAGWIACHLRRRRRARA
jgi:hypothetical protein